MVKNEWVGGSGLLCASLLVLAFAFFSSLWIEVGTIGEEWRTVGILEANPDSYIRWIRSVLVLGILPVAIGLVLYIIDFISQRKTRARILNLLPFIAGGFLAIDGIDYFLDVYHSYTKTISLANRWDVMGIESPLQIIYMGYECIGVLLLATGLFLAVTSAYLLLARQLGDTPALQNVRAIQEKNHSLFIKRT